MRALTRCKGETERSLADEDGGQLVHLLAIPQDSAHGLQDDPLAMLWLIKDSSGLGITMWRTAAAGWERGRGASPQRDWKPERVGPMPPYSIAKIERVPLQRRSGGLRNACSTTATGTRQRGELPAVPHHGSSTEATAGGRVRRQGRRARCGAVLRGVIRTRPAGPRHGFSRADRQRPADAGGAGYGA